MSDRTQLAIGRNSFSVPRITKRALEAVLATAATAFVAFLILILNSVLTARGGWAYGFDAWANFIQRPDILGTMLLTALVTVFFLQWQRDKSTKR